MTDIQDDIEDDMTVDDMMAMTRLLEKKIEMLEREQEERNRKGYLPYEVMNTPLVEDIPGINHDTGGTGQCTDLDVRPTMVHLHQLVTVAGSEAILCATARRTYVGRSYLTRPGRPEMLS